MTQAHACLYRFFPKHQELNLHAPLGAVQFNTWNAGYNINRTTWRTNPFWPHYSDNHCTLL